MQIKAPIKGKIRSKGKFRARMEGIVSVRRGEVRGRIEGKVMIDGVCVRTSAGRGITQQCSFSSEGPNFFY